MPWRKVAMYKETAIVQTRVHNDMSPQKALPVMQNMRQHHQPASEEATWYPAAQIVRLQLGSHVKQCISSLERAEGVWKKEGLSPILSVSDVVYFSWPRLFEIRKRLVWQSFAGNLREHAWKKSFFKCNIKQTAVRSPSANDAYFEKYK